MKYEGILKRTIFVILFAFILCVGVKETTVDSSAYGYNILSDTKVTLIKGESKKIKLLWSEDSVVKWSSSNKKVATVKKGKIVAKKKGKTTITAKVANRKYKCKVTVEEPYISKKNITISVGESFKLKMKGTNQYCEWSSSKKNVAMISYGEVTGKKKGTAYITAKVGKKKYKCKVRVEEPKLSTNALEFLIDDKPQQIYLKGTNRKVTWRTTDESVATVQNGMVIPKGSGWCDIIAKVGGKEYECSVHVKNELNAVYIPMGKSWHVLNQWDIKINSVKETSYRNRYSERNPEAAYILNYTYKNLGYKDSDGLYFSLCSLADAIVDANGESGYYYDCNVSLYPKELPIGAYCTAEAEIGVEHKGSFKIYYSKYDNNGTLRKAIFEVKPN